MENNFTKMLGFLQEGKGKQNRHRKGMLNEITKPLLKILGKGDELYLVEDGFPEEVTSVVDSDTIEKVNGVVLSANGDIWVTEDPHPHSGTAKWSLYHKQDRFKDQ